MLVKLIHLILLLAAEAWLFLEETWESLGVFIVLLLTFIIREIKSSRAKLHNEELFSKFLKTLPSTKGSMQFLEKHDFNNSFAASNLNQLKNFTKLWRYAEYGFTHKELEEAKGELIEKIDTFLDLSINHTFPIGDGWVSPKPSEIETAVALKHAKENIANMNKLANEVFSQHQALILLAKKKLKVNE